LVLLQEQVGDAAGVACSEEALYAADLPARSLYIIALPVPGTQTRVLTGRGPLVVAAAGQLGDFSLQRGLHQQPREPGNFLQDLRP
jgi:hypothetical protein